MVSLKSSYVSLILAIGLLAAAPLSLAEAHLVNDAPDKIAVYPKPNLGTDEHQRKLIERGEYLTKAGDCIACHTDVKHNVPSFAGGAGISTPFGTFFAPNITPDPATGIGKWTDDQFVKAMHDGIGPDGSNYFPVFPYPNFNKMSRSDILAVKAYLFSIPAVNKSNKKHDVMWPFNVRFFQYGWKLLFFQFYKGQYKNDASHSEEWNRGAYLVQGLGHCNMCHSPLNILGGEKRAYALTGNFVDGYYAPDITSNGLNGVPLEDIVAVFKEDKKLHNAGKIGGPMAEVNHDSLHYLSVEDLRAIGIYLKTVKSQTPAAATKSSGAITADTGNEIYQDKCAVCHDSGAAGAPKVGDKGAWSERLSQGLDTVVMRAIKGYNSMPPKGTCMTCSDAEIKAAVEYMLDQSKSDAGGKVVTIMPARVKLSLADGKRIYQNTCSVCHAEGKLGAPKLGDKAAWANRIHQNMDVLFSHTLYGFNRMPARGTCITCTNEEILAATKYMVEQSKTSGNYSLW